MKIQNEISQKINNGELKKNPAQEIAIASLDELLSEINSRKKFWQRFRSPKNFGIYLWGGVGGGKTMLMDLFFAHAKVSKQRIHFHEFMLDVHNQIHNWRKQNSGKQDPVPIIAKTISRKIKLLCLDEFSVDDIADAMILAKLFTTLFENNVVVVTTSNVEVNELYKHGINRAQFLPFIELAKNKMNIINLNTQVDHRQQKLIAKQFYFYGKGAPLQFETLWGELTAGLTIHPAKISHQAREINFEKTCGGIVRSTFLQLCQTSLGAVDYIEMASRFHTLFLENVPVIETDNKNELKRFITLIDTWYDNNKRLIMLCASSIAEIYTGKNFEFARTLSRLQEMTSKNYLQK